MTDQAFSLAIIDPKAMSDRTSGKLQLSLAYNQVLGESDKALLSNMLDRIQSLEISNDQNSLYDRIWEDRDKAGIFSPPTTHLVAAVEDLTNILANAFEEATDMDEDVGDNSYTTLPPAVTYNGKWVRTSTYHVYMVDTLKNGGGEGGPLKHRHIGRHNRGTGNGDANSDCTGTDDASRDGADNQNDGNVTRDNNNKGDEKSKDDDDYDLEAEEERSLGPNKYDVFEEPLEAPQLETMRGQLANTDMSIKKMSQRLKTEEDDINDRWVELLRAEQAFDKKLQLISQKLIE